MERLLALSRTTSSAGAVVSLVIANLIPLVGVLFWGWHLWTIMALYWVENGIIGLVNIAKILAAEGPGGTSRTIGRPRPSDGQARIVSALSRTGTAGFFVVHYGLFWLVHGIFVLVALPDFAAAMAAGPAGPSGPIPLQPGIAARMDQVIVGAVGLTISHVVSYWLNYLGRGEYRRVSPQEQAQAPYGRLVVLHVSIIFGAMVSSFIGAPIGALLVLVALKIALDLRFHLREHAGLRPAGDPPPAAVGG